jgi:hypothetical protein
MKEIFEKIVQVGMIILVFACCKSCTSDYIKGGDNKAIANYQKIIADNTSATAQYDPIYKQTTIKIAGLPVKTYDFKYHFTVENATYDGEVTLSKLPENNNPKIYYLKENPSFNTFDPKKELELEKEKNSSNGNLYWGIFWGILGLILVFGFISNINESIRNKKLGDQDLSAHS